MDTSITNIFLYGSIDMTKFFMVTKPIQVKESLRPFLYTDRNGHVRLNITVRNKTDRNGRYTHDLTVSAKGVDGSVTMCELVEFVREAKPEAKETKPDVKHQPKTEDGTKTKEPAKAENPAKQNDSDIMDMLPF